MGALLSVLIIWILTGILVYEAVDRLVHGSKKIDAKIMLITSGIGVAINIMWVVLSLCLNLYVSFFVNEHWMRTLILEGFLTLSHPVLVKHDNEIQYSSLFFRGKHKEWFVNET